MRTSGAILFRVTLCHPGGQTDHAGKISYHSRPERTRSVAPTPNSGNLLQQRYASSSRFFLPPVGMFAERVSD